MRWNNSHITGAPEEEEWEKGAEGLFEQLIAETFPHLGKETGIQVLAAQRIPFQINKTRSTPRHVIAKPENYKDKERILKAARDKRVLLNLQGKTHKGSRRPVPWNLAGQKGGVGNGQCAEWEHMQRRILSPARLSFRIERERKALPDRQNLMEFMTTKPALQEILRGDSVSGKQQRLRRTRGLTKSMKPSDNTMALNPYL